MPSNALNRGSCAFLLTGFCLISTIAAVATPGSVNNDTRWPDGFGVGECVPSLDYYLKESYGSEYRDDDAITIRKVVGDKKGIYTLITYRWPAGHSGNLSSVLYRRDSHNRQCLLFYAESTPEFDIYSDGSLSKKITVGYHGIPENGTVIHQAGIINEVVYRLNKIGFYEPEGCYQLSAKGKKQISCKRFVPDPYSTSSPEGTTLPASSDVDEASIINAPPWEPHAYPPDSVPSRWVVFPEFANYSLGECFSSIEAYQNTGIFGDGFSRRVSFYRIAGDVKHIFTWLTGPNTEGGLSFVLLRKEQNKQCVILVAPYESRSNLVEGYGKFPEVSLSLELNGIDFRLDRNGDLPNEITVNTHRFASKYRLNAKNGLYEPFECFGVNGERVLCSILYHSWF